MGLVSAAFSVRGNVRAGRRRRGELGWCGWGAVRSQALTFNALIELERMV